MFHEVLPDLARVTTLFVNCWLLGRPGGPWVLVDTGLPGFASLVRAAATARFGSGTRPEAILLTHGHFDHAGSARELAEGWGGVPIYAAAGEVPFLNGRADYAPGDPTVGGFMAFMSRFFPTRGRDLRPFLRELPTYGSVPGLPDWRWLPTPGHSPGQAAFWRERDGTLIAGDAFATTNLQSWMAGGLTWARHVGRPPLPFTPDWESARRSFETLVALRPQLAAPGHGYALRGEALADGLHRLAAQFHPPRHGRYAHSPARPTTPDGYIPLPPAPPDPLPWVLAGVGAAVGGALLWATRPRRRQRWSGL